MLRAALLPTLILLVALGCAKTTGPGPGTGTASPRAAAAREAPTPDLAAYFKPYRAGAFVVYDLKRGRHLRHDEELPVSKRSLSILKEIMTLEEAPGYRLSGKTGGGPLAEGRFLGWFVGYLETRDNVYFFATQVEGPTYQSIRDERIRITKDILADLGHLPKKSTED